MHNSHSVLRQSTSLIRGNDSGRTQSFNRFQVLHQNIFRVHSLRCQRKGYGDRRQQTLRHICYDDTNHKHNVLDNLQVEKTNDEKRNAQCNGDGGNQLDKLGDFDVNRRRFVGRFCGQTGDLTHDRAITRSNNHASPGTRVDNRGIKAQVARLQRLHDQVTLRILGQVRRTILRFRFTSQRRVVHLQFVRLHDANIRWHRVAVEQIDDVPRNQLPCINNSILTVANALTLLRDHIFKSFHDLLRLGFLQIRESCRNSYDDV
mmetsp:Transcript_2263/g.6924  ORF Transcript_2263/g.6924 Transcript_2263/m.6924 type:complete len:261 (-) Transcript_2263:421-1203(-)